MLSIWHCVGDCHTFRLRLDDTNLVLSIGLILNYLLYNIFLREHLPNIASEIGKIDSFQYTVFAQWKVFALNKVVEQTKILPRDWQLTDGWDLQMFLSPLVQGIIMIRSEPRTLRVIFTDLSKQVKHLPKRIIKDDQKKINAVLFVSSLLLFEWKSLQLLLSLSENTNDESMSSIHSFSLSSEYTLLLFSLAYISVSFWMLNWIDISC